MVCPFKAVVALGCYYTVGCLETLTTGNLNQGIDVI